MQSLTAVQATYSPRGAASTVFSARDKEVCLVGPAGTGKSLGCLWKLNLACLKYPGAKALIVRKTQATLPSSALATWRKLVIPELLAAKAVTFHGGGPQDPPQYRYPNGSVVNIGGLDKASKVLSTEYDLIYVQEATEATEDDWEVLLTRLRNWVLPYQQLLADCNPDAPHHWLNRRMLDGRTRQLASRHTDNPALYDEHGQRTARGEAYLSTLDHLSGVRRKRLYEGIWAAAEGVIYDGWDDAVNLVDPWDEATGKGVKIGDDWDRWWSVDFGYTHPFVLQCWAEDPDGRLYLYREIYRTRTLVSDHAKRILKAVTDRDGNWKEPKPQAVICDHDAEGRATLAAELGLSIRPADKAVLDGIQSVSERIRSADDGKPRLFILRGATIDPDLALREAGKPASTYEELASYVWAPDATGQRAREAPVKENDDGMDALRYMVMARSNRWSVPKVSVMGVGR